MKTYATLVTTKTGTEYELPNFAYICYAKNRSGYLVYAISTVDAETAKILLHEQYEHVTDEIVAVYKFDGYIP